MSFELLQTNKTYYKFNCSSNVGGVSVVSKLLFFAENYPSSLPNAYQTLWKIAVPQYAVNKMPFL